MLDLAQALALAVIMGAAVGSAVTTQIIAFDISKLSYILTAVGLGLSLWKARRIVSLAGSVVMGLGILFIGLGLMSGFMHPLRTHQPFLELMASMTSPLPGILIGAVFTAIVNSSTATLGVVIALASQGLIPLDAGIALVFGANIGTTLTALLASIGQPRSALHAAVGLATFKVLMVVIWLPLIGPLEAITRAVSPSAQGLALAEQLAYEVPRQVANVHLIVNLSMVLLLLPFTRQLAALIVRICGEEPAPRDDADDPAPALNAVLLEAPPLAVDALRREVAHLGQRVAARFDAAMPAILDALPVALDARHAQRALIGRHHAAIVGFAQKLLQPELPSDIGLAAVDLVEAADYLESIGDLVDRDMIARYRSDGESSTALTTQAREQLRTLGNAVGQELHRAVRAVADADPALARTVLEAKPQVRNLERAAVEWQIEPPSADAARRVRSTALERELSESLRRTYSLVRRFVRVGSGLLHADRAVCEA